MTFISASLKINITEWLFASIPLISSVFIMILGVIAARKDSRKNAFIIKTLAFIVPVLHGTNGFILSDFKPFGYVLLGIIFAVSFIPIHSDFIPKKLTNFKFISVVLPNLLLIYGLFRMKNPDKAIVSLGLILGLIPFIFNAPKLFGDKKQLSTVLIITLSSGFVLAFALNLPALSIGSFMFPAAAILGYAASILYLKYHFKSVAAEFNAARTSDKITEHNVAGVDKNTPESSALFTAVAFLVLLVSNLLSMALNL